MKVIRNTLTLPSGRHKLHPLFPKLRLLAVLLSGKLWGQQDFRKKFEKLYMIHGKATPNKDTKVYSDIGEAIAYNKMRVSILQM